MYTHANVYEAVMFYKKAYKRIKEATDPTLVGSAFSDLCLYLTLNL